MRLEGKIRVIAISIIVVVCSGIIFVLMWIRDSMPLGNQVMIDWAVLLLSIFLEVFGISLFLDWLIDSGRRRRLEPRKQIALRRFFTTIARDLYIQLARNNKIGEPLTEDEDIRLREKGIVTPSTNLPLDRYILQLASATESASREIESLVDRFGDLFDIEFVNALFQLGEIGYYIVQDGVFIQTYAKSNRSEQERAEVAEKVNETFDLRRQMLMKACTDFIVTRIYPQSSSSLIGKIRFYLLNFFVAYYPEICDQVLEGKRMKIPKRTEPEKEGMDSGEE
ncbi:MAG: hypothetical protein ACFFER_17855 [Candidatus Thorarchaeota archaeon]